MLNICNYCHLIIFGKQVSYHLFRLYSSSNNTNPWTVGWVTLELTVHLKIAFRFNWRLWFQIIHIEKWSFNHRKFLTPSPPLKLNVFYPECKQEWAFVDSHLVHVSSYWIPTSYYDDNFLDNFYLVFWSNPHVLKLSQNKKGQKISRCTAVEKDTKNGAPGKFLALLILWQL